MDWITHDQTRRPVDGHLQVLIHQRSGDYFIGKAEEFRWHRYYLGNDPRDITHYLLVQKPKEPSVTGDYMKHIPVTRPAETTLYPKNW